MSSARPIREVRGLDEGAARELVATTGEPVVLRGLAGHWPVVAAGREGAPALAHYLRARDRGTLVDAVMTPPEAEGRIFYQAALEGFTFLRNRIPLSQVIEQAMRYGALPRAPAVAAQSAPVRECLAGFEEENKLPVAPAGASPRIWVGGAVTTPIHLDEWRNIACVAGGRRRFTLFPPAEVVNLYVGPLDYAPTGAPMSLVELAAPDLARFPRFARALEAAQSAELGPGDAICIPPLWWHHVQSLESFNVLVNYWWRADRDGIDQGLSGFDVLVHAILGFRSMDAATREAWGALFAHYVFGDGAAADAHIPAAKKGILGDLSPQDRERLRAYIARRMSERQI